jgi:hypothetical protein
MERFLPCVAELLVRNVLAFMLARMIGMMCTICAKSDSRWF